MADKPSVGRIVHYVAYGTPGGEYTAGAHRAAIITETEVLHQGVGNQLAPDGTLTSVSLAIFNPTGYHWRQGVPYDPDGAPGTWHWPERT